MTTMVMTIDPYDLLGVDPEEDDHSGTADFAYVSKYKKGKKVPEGITHFDFSCSIIAHGSEIEDSITPKKHQFLLGERSQLKL